MTLPRPRFDRTVSLGNVLVILGMLAGFFVVYTNFVSTVKDQQAQIEANRIGLADLRKQAEDRVQKYAPTIEALLRANEVQDTRFQNLIMNQSREAIGDLAKTVSELARSVAQTHEDIAVLKAQLGREARGEAPGR